VIAYVDSSVVLRIILRDHASLAEWPRIERGVASGLLAVECYRTLDRYWREDRLNDATFEMKRNETAEILVGLNLMPLTEGLLHSAAQPFPTIIATLDAIHLSSAIAYRAVLPPGSPPLLFATHDAQLARAARAMNFEVIGT
jgi:predicted nucleic acid-binding protein